MRPTVIKIGGGVAENDELVSNLAAELLGFLPNRDRGPILLVHGGGSTISEVEDRWGYEPSFVDGLRKTSAETMPLVDMALAGAVNKRLVRLLRRSGLNAWGLCGADGGLILAKSIGSEKSSSRIGRVASLDIQPLGMLWKNGYLPVLASPASDAEGRGLNVNADEVALALALDTRAQNLIFISDIPGVLSDGRLIRRLDSLTAKEKIARGKIWGGMIPKVTSAIDALKGGVEAILIGDYLEYGDLERLLLRQKGTAIGG